VSTEPPPEKPRIPQPISIGGGWTFLYAILAVAFFGAGAWMVLARGVALTEPAVLVSGVGGLWFVARTMMTMRKKP
jgi:hypothetical protein